MDHVQRHEALDALGVVQAEEEAGQPAPVVREQLDALEAHRVEERDHVARKLLLQVAARRGVGPAHSAQVGHDEAVTIGQQGNDMAPLVPVLRPAVQQDDDLAVPVAGLGDVHPQAAGVDEPMRHTVENR
jgi:hypothetical protein